MNKIFDFSRFGKLFVHDFRSAYAHFGIVVLILALVPHLSWLVDLTAGVNTWSNYATMEPMSRWMFISMAVTLAACMAPSRIYKNVNLEGKGNYFAMLPASLPEKYVSMLIYSFVLAPLAVCVGSVVVDTVLTLLPFGPYKEFIWKGWFLFWPTNDQFFNDSTVGSEIVFGQTQLIIVSILSSLLTMSVFLFTNTLFKKHKVNKTFQWIVLIVFVLILVFVPLWNHNYDAWLESLVPWVRAHSIEQLANIVFGIMTAVLAIADFLLLFFTYRRLKRMQY